MSKVRDRSQGPHGGSGWIPVPRNHSRRLGDVSFDWITVFVDNLPEGVSHSWLGKLFNNYGVVKDVYIPVKRSKVTGRHFGFIRYNCDVSADIAVSKTNGMWVEDKKLFVKIASFGQNRNHKRIVYSLKDQVEVPEKTTSFVDLSDSGKPQTNNLYTTVNGRSFADIVKGDSKALEKEGIRVPKLHLSPQENEWLYRSVVATLLNHIGIPELKDEIKTAFVEDIQIRAMGGRSILLTFSDTIARDEILNDNLMNRWFLNVHPWMGDAASHERFAWLRCIGMPLEAWHLDSFKRIGELWGHFMAIDDATLSCSSFDIGRLLIATTADAKIDVRIQVELKGVSYSVKVVEEECDVQIQRLKSTNEEGDDSHEGPLHLENLLDPIKGILVSNVDEISKVDVMDADYCSKSMRRGDESKIDGNPINHNCLMATGAGYKIDVDNDPLMVPNSIKSKTDDSFSICDSLLGDSREEIESFEDNAVARQLDNSMEVVEEVAETDDDGANRKSDESASLSDANHIPIQATIKGRKGKRNRKSLNEILGYARVNANEIKGKMNNKKCVVLRSAVASAALSASISSNDINNRNRILLDEAQAIWEVDKLFGISYDGDENEVISKIAEMEALNKARAEINL